MKKTLAFLMLFTYLRALLLPCLCKTEPEFFYEVEQQKKDAEPDETNFLRKEILSFHLVFWQNTEFNLQDSYFQKNKINADLLIFWQDNNSPIFLPPPKSLV